MMPTAPIAAMISPARIRLRLLPTFSTADSRIAANGETRPVRSAGMIAERTVTNVPSTIVRTIVRGNNCNEVDGNSTPRAPRNPLSAAETPTPAIKPSNEPTTPTTTDSISIARVTCARCAPDCSQQRVLSLPLRGSDREHVVDHEAGNTHGDQREHRQEDA